MAKSERKIKPFSNINTNDLKYSFVQNLKEKREEKKTSVKLISFVYMHIT